ncbi:MAG: hypothetical protein GY946_11510 [bacterium]|nr:hypothetical protein [bacterium]
MRTAAWALWIVVLLGAGCGERGVLSGSEPDSSVGSEFETSMGSDPDRWVGTGKDPSTNADGGDNSTTADAGQLEFEDDPNSQVDDWGQVAGSTAAQMGFSSAGGIQRSGRRPRRASTDMLGTPCPEGTACRCFSV